ncbi:MAG: stage 0 sporulation family protein [Candidatus Zixiibacteriota bacterium]
MAINENNNKKNDDFKPDCYIVGFKRDRKDYFIERNHLGLEPGEWVIVQAERGRDMGEVDEVISEKYLSENSDRRYPLEILRRANESDIEIFEEHRCNEANALEVCEEFIDFRGLDMKLVDSEYQFDGNKLTFFYTADQRVDFRELVKDLAATFRTRIELRQIGVRDEAKKLGGLAPCGRELCCCTWLDEFKPVTSQLARDQQLAVNPAKISGLCGRLMCCLTYEEDFYQQLNRKFPYPGQKIPTDRGIATVQQLDMIKDKIFVRFNEGDVEIFSLIELRRILSNRKEFLQKWLPSDK